MQWSAYPAAEQIHISEFYSFFDVHYDKGYTFAGETHDFWECLYVLDGSICISADDRVYNLAPNQIIFHKPLELHKFHIDHESGATLLIFSFALEGNLAEHLMDKVFRLNSSQRGIMEGMLDYLRSTRLEADEAAMPEHKYLVHDHASPLYFQMLTTYVYQLILSLIDHGRIAEVSTAPDVQLFSTAVNFISEHMDTAISVENIAEHCHTSQSTLKRIFTKYAGISIHKYILTLKIKKATELLKNGVSVTLVSEALGFSSQAYFSACFKRETGSSPIHFTKGR